MFEFCSAILAIFILLAIACPKLLIPAGEPKQRKRVGSAYWGVYSDCPQQHPHSNHTVEVPKPIKKIHVIAGSSMYAGGNGNGRR